MKGKLIEALWHFINEETIRGGDCCIPGFTSGQCDGWGRARTRVKVLIEKYAAPALPAEAVCFYKDGDSWCCVHGDFINLQESPAGFGDTFETALINLKEMENK